MAFLLEVLLAWCEKLWGICCRCFISAVLLPTWLPLDEETDRQPFRNQCDIQSTCLPQDGRCCWGGVQLSPLDFSLEIDWLSLAADSLRYTQLYDHLCKNNDRNESLYSPFSDSLHEKLIVWQIMDQAVEQTINLMLTHPRRLLSPLLSFFTFPLWVNQCCSNTALNKPTTRCLNSLNLSCPLCLLLRHSCFNLTTVCLKLVPGGWTKCPVSISFNLLTVTCYILILSK